MTANPVPPAARELEPHMVGAPISDEQLPAAKDECTPRFAAMLILAAAAAVTLVLVLLSVLVDFTEDGVQCGADGCSTPAAVSCAERVTSEAGSCGGHSWCQQMVSDTLISYDQLSVALAGGANGSAVSPRLFMTLDYRYHQACHIPGSQNLFTMALRCDSDAAQTSGGAAATSIVALGATGGGASGLGPYELPYPSLTSAAAAGATIVVYCANAA